jgi:alcohol dehydrogenase YqhD (iron-dependent ADH family)
MGVFMGEVVCFETREILEKTPDIVENPNVETVIDSIYQRKNQIDCIVMIGLSSVTGSPVFLCAASEYERRLMWSYFMDYMRDLSNEFEDE